MQQTVQRSSRVIRHEDLQTYCAVLLLTLVVAMLASLLPAWRSARVEPVEVLRQE